MIKVFASILIAIVALSSAFAEMKYTDFESGTPSAYVFSTTQTYSVVDNPLINTNNSSLKVARAQHGTETWAGFNLYIGGLINFSAGDSIFRFKVLSSNPSVNKVTLKIENYDNSNISKSVSVNYTGNGDWQELVFDFTSQAAMAGTYGKLTLFIGDGSTSTADVWYLDDIYGSNFTPAASNNTQFNFIDATGLLKDFKLKINGVIKDFTQMPMTDPVLGNTKYVCTASLPNYRIDSCSMGHYAISIVSGESVLKTYTYDIYNNSGKTQVSNFVYYGSLDDKGVANAIKVSAPPVIDGTVDNAWNSVPAHYLTKQTNNAGLANVGEIAAYYKVLWDDTYFYTLTVINDKHKWVNNANNAFNDDVEYYFDMLKNKGAYVADDYRYRYNWGGLENLKKGTPAGTLATTDITKSEVVLKNGNDTIGRVVEMRFPFAKLLGTFVAKDSASFNFDVKSVDNNSGTGRTDLIAWRDSMNDFNTVNSLGSITLRNIVPEIISNSTSICLNNSLTVKDSILGEVNTVSWNFGDGASPATADSRGSFSINYATTGFKTITLTVNGNYTISKTIEVKAVPQQFNVAVSKTEFCSGSSDSLMLASSANSVDYQLFRNDVAEGNKVPGNGDALLWMIAKSGEYKVVATNSEGCSLDMLNAPNVTVFDTPVLNLDVPQVFCSTSGSAISIISSVPSVKYSLFKDSSVEKIETGNSGVLKFDSLFNGTYKVAAIDTINQCSSVSETYQIQQDNLPALYTFSASQPEYCKGDSTEIVLAGSENGSNYQLIYNSNPVGNIIQGTGNSLEIPVAYGSGLYKVMAFKSQSCLITLDDSVQILELASPVIDSISLPNDYCVGTSVTARLLNSNSQTSYQLYKDDAIVGDIADGNGSDLLWNNLVKGIYKIKAASKTTNCQIFSKEYAVVEKSAPIVGSITGLDKYCADAAASLSLSASESGIKYQLMLNSAAEGSLVSGDGNALTWNNLKKGTYKVVATNSNTGCVTESAAKTIQEIALPAKPVISVNENVLSSSVLSGNEWYLANNKIENAVNQTYTASASGIYKVFVTKDGCSNASDPLTFTLTSVENVAVAQFKVVPNPNKGVFYLQADNTQNYSDVMVFDATGKLVQKISKLQFAGNKSEKIDLGSAVSGLYFIQVKTEKQTFSQRIIVK